MIEKKHSISELKISPTVKVIIKVSETGEPVKQKYNSIFGSIYSGWGIDDPDRYLDTNPFGKTVLFDIQKFKSSVDDDSIGKWVSIKTIVDEVPMYITDKEIFFVASQLVASTKKDLHNSDIYSL